MPLLDCMHDSSYSRQACLHLLGKRHGQYHKVFTGRGKEFWLACPTCANEQELSAIPWRSVCDSCFAEIMSRNYWAGVRGQLEIATEQSSIVFSHRTISGKDLGLSNLRLIQPCVHAQSSIWIGLTDKNVLVEMDLDSGSIRTLVDVLPSELDLTQSLSLVCSPTGQYICLTQTLGDHGVVINRDSGRIAQQLRRDGYYSEVTPFPVAFVVHQERTFLIHATAWNRLDISDPATGELLTERGPVSYKKGEARPPHYLDYFHGRLVVSPSQDFIADDGWVWQPTGMVRTWNISRWLGENVWESEDGPTVRYLTYSDLWGGPLCWVDSRTLAIWNDKWNLPAVHLFDVVSGKESDWFPGPEVAAKTDKEWPDNLADFGEWLVCDGFLFAISERFGISVWNLDRGTCLHRDASFAPIAYHPTTKEFLTIRENGEIQLSRIAE